MRYHLHTSHCSTLWFIRCLLLVKPQDAPISLEQARARRNASLKLLPHSLSTPTAAVEGKDEDEGDGEASKGIETDKNGRGLSPLLSYNAVPPNLLAAEEGVFGRRDTAVVAPGRSFREDDGRNVVWEGHGEGCARTSSRVTSADEADVTPKLDSSAGTAAAPEGSRISRQGGLRGVEDASTRSPPPVTKQSPGGSVASESGGSTGVIREAVSAGELRDVGPFATKDAGSQAEAGSNVVNVDDKQAEAHVGENAAPIAGSDVNTIGGKGDRICHAAAAACVGEHGSEKHDAHVSRASGPPIAEHSSHMSAEGGTVTSGAHKSSKRGAKLAAEAKTGEAATAVVASGPSIFPPPLESVIEMGKGEGERGSGSEAIDRLYGEHCLEREAVARAFFDEQDGFRRRFLAAVDLVELDKAVECAGLELRNGCRAAQTLKSRLKIRWREATVLPCGAGGLSRCTGREAHQATLRWQDQIRVVIAEYKDLLGDILGRQELEAGALQIAQEMEVPKGKAPKLEVRFAFPGIFDEVSFAF